MWVIQKADKVALWNKRYFEEKKMEIIQHVENIQYGYLLNKYKTGHLEGNFTPAGSSGWILTSSQQSGKQNPLTSPQHMCRCRIANKRQIVPHSKHSLATIKTNKLMLYTEIIAIRSDIHTKHINILCGQNVRFNMNRLLRTLTNP